MAQVEGMFANDHSSFHSGPPKGVYCAFACERTLLFSKAHFSCRLPFKKSPIKGGFFHWCRWRESDSRPLPYQGNALPLSHTGIMTYLLCDFIAKVKRKIATCFLYCFSWFLWYNNTVFGCLKEILHEFNFQ